MSSCRIVTVGGIKGVFDANGVADELYQEALEFYNGDSESAINIWEISNSEEFSTLGYDKPTLRDVLAFSSNLPQTFEETLTLSSKEVAEVKEMASHTGFKTMQSFRDKLNEVFKPNGFFSLDKQRAVDSGLYTVDEIDEVNPSVLFNALNRLDKHLAVFGDSEIANAKYSGIKNNTRPKNMFGSYPSVTEAEVIQFVLDNGEDALIDSKYPFVSQNISDGILGATRAKNQENKKAVPKLTPKDVIDRLSLTGLENKVHILSPKQMEEKLQEIGVDKSLSKQVIGRKGARELDDYSMGIINRIEDLAIAEQMERNGKTPIEIKLATGWERGGEFISIFENRTDDEVVTYLESLGINEPNLQEIKDNEQTFQRQNGIYNGKWRYEIGDGSLKNIAEFTFTRSSEGLKAEVYTVKLGSILLNDELYRTYPGLIDTLVTFFKPSEESNYREMLGFELNGNIYINYDKGFGLHTRDRSRTELGGNKHIHSVLSHEIQHIIQNKEGFEGGSSLGVSKPRVLGVIEKVERNDRLTEEEKEIKKIIDSLYPNKTLTNEEVDKVALRVYGRSVGEVEARNVERRISNKEGLLRSTEDIIREKQLNIIQFQQPLLSITPNGFVYDGEVFFNEEVLNNSTSVHEFNHLYTGLLKQTNRPLYERGLELVEREGQEYIDHVRRTQPNLEGEALLEEALTQAVGEQGARIIDETRRNKFVQFLADVWASIKNQLGLSAYSNSQVQKMNLKEYVNAMAVDLLSGERLVQERRTADQLPLTLSVFNRPEFEKMKGKMVNPVTILNSLNQQGIKQIEKDLIKAVIEENYQGQKKVSYDELELKVRVSLMPLERISTSSYADYGMDNLGDGNYGEAKTLILNSPIEHGVTGHFSGDFKASGRKNIKYVPKQLDGNTWVAVEEGYESQGATQNNIYQFVGTAGTKESVENWIDNYEKPLQEITKDTEGIRYTVDKFYDGDYFVKIRGIVEFDTGSLPSSIRTEEDAVEEAFKRLNESSLNYRYKQDINKGMFGHIRVWQDGQDFYVAELQSDYFQKNNAKRDLLFKNEQYKKVQDDIVTKKKNIDRKESEIDSERYKVSIIDWENYAKDILNSGKYNIYYEDSLSEDMFKEPLTKVEIRDDNTLVYRGVFKRGSRYDITNPNYEVVPKLIGEGLQLGIATSLVESAKSKGIEFKTSNEGILSLEDELGKLKSELAGLNKNLIKTEEEVVRNLPKDQKQFIASQKIWEQRMVREAIKEASLSGATSLRFPTPYTLSVIEGYVSEDGNLPYEIQRASDNEQLTEGDEIYYAGEDYTVIEADGNNIVVAESSKVYSSNIDDFISEEVNYRTEETMNNELGFETQNAFYTLEEWEDIKNSNSTYYLFQDIDLEDIADEKEGGTYEINDEKVEDIVREAYQDNYSDISQLLGDMGYENIFTSGDTVYYTEYRTNTETFGQPDSYDRSSKDDFTIEDSLDDTQQTVASKYEEIAEILQKERGDNFEVVTDENGFDWYETKITPEEVDNPIIAFQLPQNHDTLIQSLIDSGEITYTNDEGIPCAKEGVVFGGASKGKWRLVEDLKGKPSHKQGGVDLAFDEDGVSILRNGGDVRIKAQFGLLVTDPPVKKDISTMSASELNKIDSAELYKLRKEYYDKEYKGKSYDHTTMGFNYVLTDAERDKWINDAKKRGSTLPYTTDIKNIAVPRNPDGTGDLTSSTFYIYPQKPRQPTVTINSGSTTSNNTTAPTRTPSYLHPTTGKPLDPNLYVSPPAGTQVDIQVSQNYQLSSLLKTNVAKKEAQQQGMQLNKELKTKLTPQELQEIQTRKITPSKYFEELGIPISDVLTR